MSVLRCAWNAHHAQQDFDRWLDRVRRSVRIFLSVMLGWFLHHRPAQGLFRLWCEVGPLEQGRYGRYNLPAHYWFSRYHLLAGYPAGKFWLFAAPGEANPPFRVLPTAQMTACHEAPDALTPVTVP